MGRDWPPNSFAEWMVGQNFRPQNQSTASARNPIIRVEISEDEASGDETVAIIYPRRRRRAPQHVAAESSESSEPTSTARKVRFDGGKPLKSALKKTASPNNSDDTLVDTSESSADATTSTEGESSDVDESDTSEYDAPIRRKKVKSKKTKVPLCQQEGDSEDSSAAKDGLPHETCDCRNCRKGRRILKSIMKHQAEEEVKAKAKEEASEAPDKDKNADKGKKSEKKDKKKGGQPKPTEVTDTSQAETTEADTTGDDKKKHKEQKKKEKEKQSPKESEVLAEKILQAVNKVAFKMPKYPKEMEPNLIMPVRSKVMQVEHALEGPNDPQPNAFYDATKGIARVYHGPQYGNHMAELYGKCNPAKMSLDPGTPAGWAGHPAYGPWSFSGPPPGFPGPWGLSGTPFARTLPVINDQPPRNNAEMKAAAAKGYGLSGQPPPQTPAAVRQFRQEEQAKTASDKASKKNDGNWNSGGGSGWGGNADASWGKPSDPATNADPPADVSQGQGWGGNGANGDGWGSSSKQGGDNANTNWGEPSNPPANPGPPADASQGQGWGGSNAAWNSGPKQDGVASPANFGSWKTDSGGKFERQSNKSGSQKEGNQQTWPSGKPDSQPASSKRGQSAKGFSNKPADGSQGGGGDQWAQNGVQNTGWGTDNKTSNNWNTDNNHNGDGWGQGNNQSNDTWGQKNSGGGWGATGANGEQDQHSNASHHASSPKPSADVGNGQQANTDGKDGGGWGQGISNGWGAPAGSAQGGSKNNTPPWQQQQSWGGPGNQEHNPWGGPPGSKPAAQQHASPQGQMKGGWQNTSTWDTNGKGQMPGSWNQGSRQVSPNEKNVGAFDWPGGQEPPINSNWQAPHASPVAGGPSQGGRWGAGAEAGRGWKTSQKDTGGWDKPSYQATGPTYQNTNSWQNPDIAQYTRGAADNW